MAPDLSYTAFNISLLTITATSPTRPLTKGQLFSIPRLACSHALTELQECLALYGTVK